MNMEGPESMQFLQCLAQWKSYDYWEQPRDKGEPLVKILRLYGEDSEGNKQIRG